ncbi:TauD/TfdA family dioxygenase [uncultured Sphingorhabdus sp.]|uniref:TauD/TfdA dioxygenase family protein n=1 Tax=uncultured Sphingorhabdus sp. TaxID=1686106 RepID=UPI0026066CED|nr:TauD/TfdA family dioxygenase [uncultured Sphingorhabdus sp.]HMS21035.1 TauD/TfdA family dioxygenase [Sphingorhabdus sp.]
MVGGNARISQLTPIIGTEIDGIDLNMLDDAMTDWLRDLLSKRSVLVIRDQRLDREAHKKVARIFGTGVLHTHALGGARGTDDPEVLPIRTNAESKFTAGEGWHTDVSCDPAPIAASLLYMHEVPEHGGGDTIYASMSECFDRLAQPLQALARTLKATHDGAFPYRTIYGIDPPAGAHYNKTVHPLVIRHPVNGKDILWINRGFTTRIEGMSHHENRALMELFFQHIENTLTAQCRVRWEAGTLTIWDNVATQHHAVWDYYPESRYAERISVVGPELRAA